jgi:peroxiredoxin
MSAVEWVGDFSNAERVLFVTVGILAACVIGQGFLFFNLMKQHGRLLLRLDALEAGPGTIGQAPRAALSPALSHQELAIGSVAPAFELRDLDEGVVALDDLLAPGKPVFLVFSDSGCGSCTTLLPEIAHWQRECTLLTLAVISRGTPESNRAKVADAGIRHVLLQRDRETAKAYGAQATPSAVFVRPDGTMGSQVAVGPVAIRNLVKPWVDESAGTAQASTDSGGQKHAMVTPG